MTKYCLATIVLAALWCRGLLSADTSKASKPNIVILLADDLGYGDLSSYGHPTSSTPHLDQLARDGLVFTQFYTASPVCSPSRHSNLLVLDQVGNHGRSKWYIQNGQKLNGYILKETGKENIALWFSNTDNGAALLTGRYQTRSGIYPNVLAANSIGGLPHNETTLAETLKTVGYDTAIVGKWHLGVGVGFTYLPTHQGFDYYMGIPYSNDMCPCSVCFYPDGTCLPPDSHENCISNVVPCPLFENDKIVQQPANLLSVTTNYANAATSFIRAKAASNTPFLLYMAFQHTHQPQFAGKMFTNTSIRGPFGDALSELDWGVGQVLEALVEEGIENDTLVFFTADNGPSLAREQRGGNAGLLRCGKGTTWEGGQRVPAIARWPGKISPGKTHELAATLDLFPTLVKLVGADLPNVTIDGTDMSPILFGDGKSNRDFYIYYPNDADPKVGIYAVRLRQYKAHFYSHGFLCSDTYPDVVCRSNYSFTAYNPPLLYDLNSDPSEIYNLDTTEYADIIAEIEKLKSSFEATMVWGESQMDRGVSNSAEACAQPGCMPFPSCCRTTSGSPTLDTSRAIP